MARPTRRPRRSKDVERDERPRSLRFELAAEAGSSSGRGAGASLRLAAGAHPALI
jgi:hypothetical protein